MAANFIMSRDLNDVELLQPADAAAMLGITVRTLYARAKGDPRFPQPVKVSHKHRAFLAREVREWIQLQSLLR
jgi:predicted DNA-binding transcriptional regulator AlpA